MGITTVRLQYEGFNVMRWWCTGAGLCLGFRLYTKPVSSRGVNDWCSCAPASSIVGN